MTTETQAPRQPGVAARLRSTPRAAPLAPPARGLVPSALVLLATALLLLAVDVACLRLRPEVYRVDIGNFRDVFFLENANHEEVASDGTTYRWSTDRSTLNLPPLGGAPGLLTLDLGGRPEPGDVQLTVAGRPWAGFTAHAQPRRYTFLLPTSGGNRLAVDIHSSTVTAPGEARRLGVKIEGFELALPGGALPLPAPAQYGAQLALILAAQVIVARLGGGWRVQALVAGSLAVALAVVLGSAFLLAYAYLPRLAAAGAALGVLTWVVLPLAERRLPWAGAPREVRVLWALMLLSCSIRLVGICYPTFGGQDLSLNLDRLVKVIRGQMIIIDDSSEFADGLTIYPPGPYLAVMLGAPLIGDLSSLLQGGLALLDGTSAFLVALLARRLGGNRDAARFAALLYAGSLPAFATIGYGFSAQIFGQWFTTPLALVLLSESRSGRRTWLLATLLLMFGVYSHIGVAILGVTWIGIALLITLARPHRGLWWAVGLLGGSGLAALGLLYIDIAGIMLSHAAGMLGQPQDGPLLRGATPLLLKGLRLAYTDVGVALLPLGLLLIARARPGLERLVVPLAWVLTALLFLVVDLVMALQVRYFYFALPLALSAVAIVLGHLSSRVRWGRLVAWSLVIALALQVVALWFSTVLGDGHLSMTPLTH